ncbi:hypothetical protein VitviT2T_028158 [Vitis vinifera]|uniref:Uncharacterized protein n=1 Tax=Vitis vinifera TaxID=29760 RepID=A0ABY9DSS4_VITVI|nr:hypothetical protein VitviT2T_028158 [Vitis vinifera]
MSSGGGVPTPCTRRRSPLRHSLFHPGEEFYPAEVPPSPDISHPDISQPDGRRGHFNFPGQTCPDPLIGYLTSGWERRMFQLLRLDISGSSNSTYPESFLSVYSVAVFS